MNEILLAIDIGNTTIQCGLFEGEKLRSSWRLTSEVSRTPDECWQLTEFYCDKAGLGDNRPKSVVVSSVVPAHTRSFTWMAREHYCRNPLSISVETCPFLETRCDDPTQIGADRLCNAYAGFHYYGGPLVVVDFGTAITFDVAAEDGAYLGGIIIPGPMTAAQALHTRTARLPEVTLVFPPTVIGKSTDAAIQAGLTWGAVDLIDGMIGRIATELKAQPKVIATGGYAEPYISRSRSQPTLHPNLVLEGANLIYRRARELA